MQQKNIFSVINFISYDNCTDKQPLKMQLPMNIFSIVSDLSLLTKYSDVKSEMNDNDEHHSNA